MRPDKVNKYLNRRKEREAKGARSGLLSGEKDALPENTPTKFPKDSDYKQTKLNQQGAYNNAKDEQGDHMPPSQEVVWQTESYGPLDMQFSYQEGRAMIKRPYASYQHPLPNLSYDRVAFNFDQRFINKNEDIYRGITEGALCSTSPEFNTSPSRSSVIQLAPRTLGRPEGEVLQEKEEKKKKEETEKSICDNPVMPFTLEEEFKVFDFIVRIKDYSSRRFIFINNNFGDSVFPKYRTLTMENTARTELTGKLQYDPMMEGRMYDLALKFTLSNIDHFFDEMKCLSREAKVELLKTSYPANTFVCLAMVENNLQKWNYQPSALGCENVGINRLKDQERFTFLDYADEMKFSQTVARVAEVLGRDMKLQALYHMLVLLSPCQTQV